MSGSPSTLLSVLLMAILFKLSRKSLAESMLKRYPELVQVGGRLPVLVIADSRHAGEADGDAVGGVHF